MNDFFKALDQTAEWMGDVLYQGCETLFQDIEEAADELETALDVFLEPVFGWLNELDEAITDTSRPFVHTVTPVLQEHPACVGCRNYHGEAYGEQMLVCAMHPYGAEDTTCPDWESVWG